MPIYEHQCPNCGHEFELRRSISEMDNPASCPSCGQEAKRVLSAFGAKNGLYVRAAGKGAFRSKPATPKA